RSAPGMAGQYAPHDSRGHQARREGLRAIPGRRRRVAAGVPALPGGSLRLRHADRGGAAGGIRWGTEAALPAGLRLAAIAIGDALATWASAQCPRGAYGLPKGIPA